MPTRPVLVDGVSGTGKTSVATALEARGHAVIHGDRVLALQSVSRKSAKRFSSPETRPEKRADPATGHPLAADRRSDDPAFIDAHHIWDEAALATRLAAATAPLIFVCGGARNLATLAHLFDRVFVLQADWPTIERRLKARQDEWGETDAERAIVRAHQAARILLPGAVPIDSTRPLDAVVDDILSRCA